MSVKKRADKRGSVIAKDREREYVERVLKLTLSLPVRALSGQYTALKKSSYRMPLTSIFFTHPLLPVTLRL